ncbi:MAG TPA: FHA domain-containing protein [Acidimicrobiales bacterium]|nr:FHA domain-containing protein [Acidimicrobiales bacterium]
MPSGLLTLLKYVFLVVLYLFFVRVLRAVWVELREPRAAGGAPRAAVAADAAPRAGVAGGPWPAAAHGAAGPASGLRLLGPLERRGERVALGSELTVGRASTCGLVLTDDSFVSSMHARFFRRDGGVWVEDLGSTNGTLVNDHRLTGATALAPGDVVTVGRTPMEVVT